MLKDANAGVGGAEVDADGSFLLGNHDWVISTSLCKKVNSLNLLNFHEEKIFN